MCAMRPVEIEIRQLDGAYLVSVSGHLAAAEISYLSAALEDLINKKADTIVVDLKDVEIITSEGLGLLIRTRKTVGEYGGKFALSGLVGNVLDVFVMTRLDKIFRMYDTPEAAVEAAQQ